MIQLTPRSLVVPLNENVTFTCRVSYDGSYDLVWYNGTSPITLDNAGFTVSELPNNVHMLMFDAESSLKVNNSDFRCIVDPGGIQSNVATLFILNGEEKDNIMTINITSLLAGG